MVFGHAVGIADHLRRNSVEVCVSREVLL
jgi:hypothetical protein